ncbi:hypothetical protein B0H16DRAFT_1735242 [Mycena metata]|uniref:Uncharacterized protein n=1 Tax=Mycena metata TaxID=1033252 RepID=A0AAD7MPN3_9AGAR|nr:hypothetical protein B0H16DRAFT_1735242 [Mycena metata]
MGRHGIFPDDRLRYLRTHRPPLSLIHPRPPRPQVFQLAHLPSAPSLRQLVLEEPAKHIRFVDEVLPLAAHRKGDADIVQNRGNGTGHYKSRSRRNGGRARTLHIADRHDTVFVLVVISLRRVCVRTPEKNATISARYPAFASRIVLRTCTYRVVGVERHVEVTEMRSEHNTALRAESANRKLALNSLHPLDIVPVLAHVCAECACNGSEYDVVDRTAA